MFPKIASATVWSQFTTQLLILALSGSTLAQNVNNTEVNHEQTYSIGVVAFPGFEPLDIFGPLEMLFSVSYGHKMTLAVIAATIGPVSAAAPPHRMAEGMPPMDLSYMIQPTIMATHTFRNAPALDILLVPGGVGNVALEQAGDTSVEDFVRSRYDQLDYLLSVCTGSKSLAKAGVLNGRRATTNKGAWADVIRNGQNVTWVPSARWVVDGNVWTSSGVSAGMDMAYAFLVHLYGKNDSTLINTMNGIEYAPHTDPTWDPFSIVHKVPGANMNGSLADCVKPVSSE